MNIYGHLSINYKDVYLIQLHPNTYVKSLPYIPNLFMIFKLNKLLEKPFYPKIILREATC